ncbi:NifB/NifX family molybdenum-iron cluster-binding protein [Lachnobacterium bovis]|uniref:Predicted Fe-Mo cluster-binding protein, NifX family n=1 Tax=Lachnobacterium bovis DSM 14045 TaxID=1122142 RepID=A0A1H3JCC1_9FIRM|nr:NifB/NifX family molybdenum-iron cluster-binding protein [Lachnobacterium bovis]SDY37175.1 Predicted Fe-Mo cluster-binding protein, NifX family [Lachnobacterium bovis DSM 14045]
MDKKEDEKYLVAVATSDGILVDNHFGRAKTFYIYQIENDFDIKEVEYRNVSAVCEGGSHDTEKLIENIKNLSDCRYLLVSKIGDVALNIAKSYGITPIEIPGKIEDSIEELIKFKKIQDLFR